MADNQDVIRKKLIRNLVIITVVAVVAFCLARLFSIIRI